MSVTLTSGHPRAQCVDLRASFPGRFRFAYDEAYQAERSDLRKVEAPWLTLIPCKAGRVFPWGGRRLAAYCKAGAAKRRELEAVPGVSAVQGGQGYPEIMVTFDVDRIEAVAAVLGARRPRRLSPERRAAAIERLRAHQFPARQGPPASLDSTIGVSDVFADVDGGQGLDMPPAAADERL